MLKTNAFWNSLMFDRIIDVQLVQEDEFEVLELAPAAERDEWVYKNMYDTKQVRQMAKQGDMAKKEAKLLLRAAKQVKLWNQLSYSGRVITVETPEDGPKPNISISVSMLPGYACHQLRLTIRNFTLGRGIDIRKFTQMKITAGYRDGNKQIFTCPIFSAYQSKPNPGGEFVFYGLTVGQYGATLYNPCSYMIKFNQSKMKLKEFCEAIISQLKPAISLQYFLPEDTQLAEIAIQQATYTADSGFAVTTWLATTLHAWGAQQEPPLNLLCMVEDDKFVVAQITPWNVATIPNEKQCYVIDSVKSASFTGPVLTLEAPWNPAIEPNSVFKMPMRYYTGDLLPNASDILQDKNELWRVITMDVSFSTVGKDNNMKIMALPAKDTQEVQDDSEAQEALQTAEDRVNQIRKQREKQTKVVEYIVVGTEEPPAEEDVLPSDITQIILPSTGGYTDYVIQKGDSLSTIYQRFFGSKRWFVERSKQKPESEATDPDTGEKVVQMHTFNNGDGGVPLYYFFPITILLTYQQYKTNATGTPRWGINDSNIRRPDDIKEGEVLRIPSDLESLAKQMIGDAKYANAFKVVADFYKDYRPQWAKNFEDIYYYITLGEK